MTSLQYPVGTFEPRPGTLSDADRAAHIARIAAIPARVRTAVDGLTPAQMDTPYRDGGWSPRQIAHHLADSHLNAFVRIKLALTEDHPTIKPYDQERWSELADVLTVPVDPSLAILEGLHARWVALWRAMDDAAYARTVRHPELGDVSVEFFLQLYAWHGDHHTAQIEGLRARKGW